MRVRVLAKQLCLPSSTIRKLFLTFLHAACSTHQRIASHYELHGGMRWVHYVCVCVCCVYCVCLFVCVSHFFKSRAQLGD